MKASVGMISTDRPNRESHPAERERERKIEKRKEVMSSAEEGKEENRSRGG